MTENVKRAIEEIGEKDEKLQAFIDEYVALVEKHKMCITPSNMLVTNCPYQVEVIYNSLRLAGVLNVLRKGLFNETKGIQ